MSWEERNPERIERIRAYVMEFRAAKPGILEHFQGGADPIFPMQAASDRGAGMLLFFCSLLQNISEGRLVRVLAYLWKQYDQDLFRINRLPFADLQSRIRTLTDLRDWPIWPKSPGILRSVGDFFFKHGRLVPWAYSIGDGEKCVETLCEEIFLMGRTSVFRSKARYFIWILTQLDGVDGSRFWTPATQMPLTLGHARFLREFGPLKDRKISPWITPAEKLAWFNRFYRVLFPASPWVVFTALDAYLRPIAFSGKGGNVGQDAPPEWHCRRILKGCGNCPLAQECPGCDI